MVFLGVERKGKCFFLIEYKYLVYGCLNVVSLMGIGYLFDCFFYGFFFYIVKYIIYNEFVFFDFLIVSKIF